MRQLTIFLALTCAGTGSLPAQGGRMLTSEPALYYEVVGRSGPLVVMLHGGPGIAHDYLRPEWDRLADRARVVYYDQRGCGRSGQRPPYGWRAHVLDLDRLLAALSPTEPVVLAGSSWGSMLALYYAVSHPTRVRALVLSGVTPAAVQWGVRPLSVEALASMPVARWDSVDRGLRPVVPEPFRIADPRIQARLQDYCSDVHGLVTLSAPTVPTFDRYAAIQAPTLVLRGADAQDGVDDAGAALAAGLPRARLVTIPAAGHDPWLDQPTVFFPAVQTFLRTLP